MINLFKIIILFVYISYSQKPHFYYCIFSIFPLFYFSTVCFFLFLHFCILPSLVALHNIIKNSLHILLRFIPFLSHNISFFYCRPPLTENTFWRKWKHNFADTNIFAVDVAWGILNAYSNSSKKKISIQYFLKYLSLWGEEGGTLGSGKGKLKPSSKNA